MTREPFRYRVDGAEYLERQNRVKAILAELEQPGGINVADWTARFGAVTSEVPEIPLVVGVRYRLKMLGGRNVPVHRHFADEEGTIHGLDLPSVPDPEYLELEGVFLGRRPAPAPGQTRPILLEIADRLAMLTDSDVLELEEIR